MQENQSLSSDVHKKSNISFCPLCNKHGSFDYKATTALDLNKTNFKILRCNNCQIRWISPQPNPDEIDQLYNECYFESCERDYSYKEQILDTGSCFKGTAKKFKELTSSKGRILDIGCATGEFLSELKKIELSGVGIDVSKYACQIAREKGLLVIHGNMHSTQLDNMKYIGIHISHVLEHLPNLNDALIRIRDIIDNKGVVYIEVPYQFDSILDKTNLALKRQQAKFSPFSVHHTYFFTPYSLKLLLEKHGFDLLSLTTYRSCKREGRPFSFRKLLLLGFLYLSDRVFSRGDIISAWACLRD
ncbi:MAG: class I SAM-dependent methyltransferase [Pseudomonadota bacterium]